MTVRLLADEHIARALIVGLRRRFGEIDIVRVQDEWMNPVVYLPLR